MIKHVVAWRLKEPAGGISKAANLAQMKAMLDDCASCVAGILMYEVAIAQPGLDSSYDIMLDSIFVTAEDLAAYNEHPKHLALKKFVATVRESRQCVDSEISGFEPTSEFGKAALSLAC